jgi:hypothetical protein
VNDEIREEIGLLVDKCENLLAATKLAVPPHIHVAGLTNGVQEIRDTLKGLLDDESEDEE